MSAIGLIDEVLGLAQRAAIADPEQRAILLAEIDARLAHELEANPRTGELEAIRLEVARMAAS